MTFSTLSKSVNERINQHVSRRTRFKSAYDGTSSPAGGLETKNKRRY